MTIYGTEFFAGRSETVTASAAGVVPVVCDVLHPQSVLDLGCGQGEWVDAFTHYTRDVYGVDVAAPEGDQFMRWDLRVPLILGRTFDLAMSLEVGEHLPESAADTLVDSLCRHSPTVLFSAAVLGQVGKGHINCQPHEYWHVKFQERGYALNDSIRPLIQANGAVSPWYRNNTFLYLRAR